MKINQNNTKSVKNGPIPSSLNSLNHAFNESIDKVVFDGSVPHSLKSQKSFKHKQSAVTLKDLISIELLKSSNSRAMSISSNNTSIREE